MSETKAALAERTKRPTKKILYRYMEGYGYQYGYKLSQFVTTRKSRKKLFDSLDTREYQGFLLFVHSVQQATTGI